MWRRQSLPYLGQRKRKTDFSQEAAISFLGALGHLVGLSEAAAYGEQYKKWSYDSLPILPQEWKYTVASDKEKQFKTLKELMHRQMFPKSSMPATQGVRENSFSVLSMKWRAARNLCAAFGFLLWRTAQSKRAFPV